MQIFAIPERPGLIILFALSFPLFFFFIYSVRLYRRQTLRNLSVYLIRESALAKVMEKRIGDKH